MSSRSGEELVFRIKRIYAPPEADDGHRVLIDRLWPRGLARADAAIDEWTKVLAPSTELRKWFNHDPARWAEFQDRFRAELIRPDATAELARLCRLGQGGTVTLLFGARDERHNHAVVLRAELERMAEEGR